MRDIFTFDGISSEDFNCYISGWKTSDKPVRERETIAIPGRNGDLTIDKGRYNNVKVSYKTYFPKNFLYNYEALCQFLLSRTGYCRLEDSYHPEFYRMGYLEEAFEPSMSQQRKAGYVDISFNCMPQKWYKDGEIMKEVSTVVLNRTQYTAKPLFRLYGTGTLTVNDTTITITSANEYTDVDCDTQDAFKGSTNCNSNLQLNNGKFPEFCAGTNHISYTGFTSVLFAPRWWTL